MGARRHAASQTGLGPSRHCGYAAGDLHNSASLAGRVDDEDGIEGHYAFVARLKREHGRKYSFWQLLEGEWNQKICIGTYSLVASFLRTESVVHPANVLSLSRRRTMKRRYPDDLIAQAICRSSSERSAGANSPTEANFEPARAAASGKLLIRRAFRAGD